MPIANELKTLGPAPSQEATDQSPTAVASSRNDAAQDTFRPGGAIYFPFSAVSVQPAPPTAAPTDEGAGFTPNLGVLGLVVLLVVGWRLLFK